MHVTEQCATLAMCSCKEQACACTLHAVLCNFAQAQGVLQLDKLTLFALLFVFEVAGVESTEAAEAPSVPLGVTSEQQPASSNASEDRAPSEKMELILSLG